MLLVKEEIYQNGYRQIFISKDEGKTWTSRPAQDLFDPGCNAGIIRWIDYPALSKKGILLFVNANHKSERKNLTLKISKDNGKTWAVQKTIYTGAAAYAAICLLDNADLGIVFEKDEYSQNTFVRISKKEILSLLN